MFTISNKLKLYNLKNIKNCPFKAYISQFDFKTMQNKSAMISKVYKDILQDYNFINLSKQQLKIIITEKLDDKYFLTQQEKEVEITIILNYLLRYIDYEKKQNRKVIAKKVYGSVHIGDKEIELKADAVFDNGNSIELVKYKTSSPTLSYKARTEKNLPENDIELYLLKQLGENLYSQYRKTIIASFYHLKGKNDDKDKTIYNQFLEDKKSLLSRIDKLKLTPCLDKKEQKAIGKQIKEIEDVLYFNNYIGSNIISYDYDTDLSEKILELANTKLDFNSEKCVSGDCEFCNYSTLCNHKFNSCNDKIELEEVKELKKSSGEVKLTNSQQSIINIEEGNYRVNAVPGSGKSFSVVIRTIELFIKSYKPSDILMITFTNKGAEELKEKITYWLQYYKIKGIRTKDLNIFTFNSFGASIIEKEWQRLGFTEKPQLATTIDINNTIKELLTEYDKVEWLNYKNPLLNYPNAKGAFKQLLIYFNLIKSFDYNIDTFAENVVAKDKCFKNIKDVDFIKTSKLVFEMHNKFNQKLKEKNLLQYQDQVLYLIELLETTPNLIETYGYKHIIVDEFQDTDFTQIKLLHLLLKYKDYKSLMVVGDTDQNVYGFRNTTPKNMLNFDKEFQNVKDIFLLDNFRSTPQICNVANKLIKLNTQRIDKDIISRKNDGKMPQLLEFDTIDNENKYIVDLIKEKIDARIPKHEICYIARTKKELLELQELLNENNIPSVVAANELYLNNTYVQCIVNLANFFKNTEQDYCLMEYCCLAENKLKICDTSEDLKRLMEILKETLINSFKLNIKESDTNDEINDNDKEENVEYIENTKINNFYKLLNPIIEKDIVANSFVEDLKSKTFYTFNQLLTYLQKMMLYQDDTSIEKDDTRMDAIVLTTAHSSKGKEWSIIINSINNYKYVDIKDDIDLLEEERRLLFVSITRAKDELYITYNTNKNKTKNKGKYCLFADEISDVKKIEIKTE